MCRLYNRCLLTISKSCTTITKACSLAAISSRGSGKTWTLSEEAERKIKTKRCWGWSVVNVRAAFNHRWERCGIKISETHLELLDVCCTTREQQVCRVSCCCRKFCCSQIYIFIIFVLFNYPHLVYLSALPIQHFICWLVIGVISSDILQIIYTSELMIRNILITRLDNNVCLIASLI